MKSKTFKKATLVPEETKPTYSHGFPPEEVETIKLDREEISKRDLVAEPVTLEEFCKVIMPYLRITRTETFNLNAKKATTRKKTPALTKKEINAQINAIAFKQATGESLTKEEEAFFKENAKKVRKV